MTRFPWALVFLLLVILVFRAGSAVLYGEHLLAANVYDDGFYYLEIARHIAAGDGSTFDGIALTNGYQPLWMLVLVPLVRLFDPGTVPGGLHFLFTVDLAFFALMTWALWRVLLMWSGQVAADTAVLLLSFSKFTTIFIGGTEAPLLGLLLVGLLAQSTRLLTADATSPRSLWAFGLWAGLLGLARLDYFLVAAVLGVGVLARDRRHVFRTAAPLAVPPLLALGLYLSANVALFGHALPISGAIKAGGGAHNFGLHFPADKSTLALMLTSPLILVALVLAARTRRGRSQPFLPAILPWWAAANTVYVLFLLLTVREAGKWYMVSPLLLMATCAGWMAAYVRGRAGAWGRQGIAAALGVLALIVVVSHYQRVQLHRPADSSYATHFAFAAWCNANLPDGSVIALPDAGLFAFLCRHRVMNTDGLVNDWAYAAACCEGRALQVLQARGVTHLMSAFSSRIREAPAGTFRYLLATIHPEKAGNTSLFTAEQVVHRQPYRTDTPGGESLVLWRFEPEQEARIHTQTY